MAPTTPPPAPAPHAQEALERLAGAVSAVTLIENYFPLFGGVPVAFKFQVIISYHNIYFGFEGFGNIWFEIFFDGTTTISRSRIQRNSLLYTLYTSLYIKERCLLISKK